MDETGLRNGPGIIIEVVEYGPADELSQKGLFSEELSCCYKRVEKGTCENGIFTSSISSV